MTKQDFLASLRSHLNGRIDAYEVEANVDYYSTYIEGELAKGRSEEEIMDELGQPALIAHTLIDSVKRREGEDDGDDYEYEQDYTQRSGSRPSDTSDETSDTGAESNRYTGTYYTERDTARRTTSGKSAWLILMIIGAVLLLLLILFVAASVFIFRLGWAILKYIWPVVLVIVIIGIISRINRRQ